MVQESRRMVQESRRMVQAPENQRMVRFAGDTPNPGSLEPVRVPEWVPGAAGTLSHRNTSMNVR